MFWQRITTLNHIGIVSKLIKQGVKLLLVNEQFSYVHFADEIFSRDKRLNYEPINTDDVIIVSCANSREFLKKIGIDGEIILTTSHSADSISLILDNGICIVGNLEPFEYLDAYDEDISLKDDWKFIMSHSPKIIYYAHANKKVL